MIRRCLLIGLSSCTFLRLLRPSPLLAFERVDVRKAFKAVLGAYKALLPSFCSSLSFQSLPSPVRDWVFYSNLWRPPWLGFECAVMNDEGQRSKKGPPSLPSPLNTPFSPLPLLLTSQFQELLCGMWSRIKCPVPVASLFSEGLNTHCKAIGMIASAKGLYFCCEVGRACQAPDGLGSGTLWNPSLMETGETEGDGAKGPSPFPIFQELCGLHNPAFLNCS